MSDYSVTLSTTEPNNYVGLIKLRQGDIASQSIQATITANGQLFNFDRLAVFFNAVLPNGNVVRDKVTKVDYANSKLNYIVADSFLQEVATISAWFSFESGDKIVDSTKNFRYIVEAGWQSCITQGNYIYELSEIQREIEEIISNKDFTSLISSISSLETDVKYLDNSKASKDDLITKISQQNEKISNIISGTPKGTFATLAALQTAYPSGKEGVFLVFENGHWYYYASGWKDGGVYQSVGIADGSVGWAKRTPVGSQAQVQYFGTGKINFDLKNKFIVIPKDTTIVVGKNLIQISNDITTAIPIVGAIKFFALTVSLQVTNFKCYTSGNFNNISESEVIIAVGNIIAQTVEMNGDYLINGVDKDNRIEDLEIKANGLMRLMRVTVSNNLVDKSIIKFGGYYDFTNGTWKDRADINSTGFISCKPQDTFIASASGNYVGGNVTFWNKKEEYVSGIDVSADNGAKTSFTVPENDNIASFKMSFKADLTDSYIINKGIVILPYDEYNFEYGYNEDISSPNIKLIEENLQEIKTTLGLTLQGFNSIGDISTTQYRSKNYKTTFWLTKINRDTFNGGKIKPKVRLTSSSVDSGDRKSVLDYITNHDTLCCINAGVFDVTTGIVDGRLIIDGTIQKDSAPVVHQNQWTLGIKSDGSLSAYDSTISASTILQDGCESAVTGFVPIIMNGSMVDKSLFLTYEHLTQPNPRQVICQTALGDYFVLSCDGRKDGEEGLTLEQIGEILLSFGVTFAYNLDGGGSTQTFVKKRRINRLIENRPVPSIIVFE